MESRNYFRIRAFTKFLDILFKCELTSQLDPKEPSENTSELYDLSPQRMVGLPVRASRINCVELVSHTITQLHISETKTPINGKSLHYSVIN